MQADRSVFTDTPATARSAIANGTTLWIDGVDGRSREARRFRDVYGDLVAHLGGSDYATEPQKHLARRAAALVVWAEMAESKLATDGDLNIQNYTTTANTLRRLLQDIGLQRVARDVTTQLGTLLEQAANSPTDLPDDRIGEPVSENGEVG